MKKKKILVVCTTDSMIWNFLTPHIDYLTSNENIVDCVCSKTGFYFDELNKAGYCLEEIPFKRSPYKLMNFLCYKTLQKKIIEQDYDLVFCHEPVGGAIARIAARKSNSKVIYMAHGFHFFKGGKLINNIIYKTIERILARFSDAIITLNDEDFEAANKFNLKKSGGVYKINGIGLDVSKFSPIELHCNASKMRAKENIDVNDFVLINIGELIPRKNTKASIEAFANANIEKSILLICGEGTELDSLKNLVKKLKVENKVKFLGFRKDIKQLLCISDAFLFTSLQEGLCVAGMEAMSAGLPLITSNVRGIREYSINGKTGFTCDPNDISKLSENISEIYRNVELRKKISEYNMIKINDFSIDTIITNLSIIYDQVVGS